MSFNPEPLALFQVAQQVVDIFIVNAKKKGITLRNRISPEFEVVADSNMIFTVMRNLTSNAIKFTSEGDEVTITAEDEGMFIKCSVKDTGLGITEEDQKKLFRIDIHHSEIGTDQEKGTGLGLLLCKELIEKNGGTIWVESSPGKGSEFFFSIPKS
jgi:signal transduction histidine kinase